MSRGVLDPVRLPVPLRRLLGRAEYAGLVAIGRLSERSTAVYRADARLSARRRVRDRIRHDRRETADPTALRRSERSVFSQNGEDGVIAEIFRRIGTTSRHAVEIGAADGGENCTRALVEAGWTAHWIEADPARAAQAAEVGGAGVRVIADFAYRSTVVERLRAEGLGPEPDLLVVDTDGDEDGILDACLAAFRPRVAVVEYNAAFSPAAMWALPPAAATGWDGTFRHGASLGALDHTARCRGYRLVHCDAAGVNAFFVRDDLAGDRFHDAGRLATLARVSSFSPNPFGHPRSRRAVAPMTPLSLDDVRAITVVSLDVTPTRHPAVLSVDLGLANDSDRWLTSPQGPFACNLVLRWVTDGTEVPPDLARIPLPRPVAPRSTARIRLLVEAPPPVPTSGPAAASAAGHAVLRASVVAEGVAWRELLGGPGAHCDAEVAPTRARRVSEG